MVSVICCYNNEKVYKELLLASLQLQNINYELIAISNQNGEFKSAASALNYGASRAKSKVLVFCHQDVELLEEDALDRIRKECLDCNAGDIIGIAGNKSRDKKIISNILQEKKEKSIFKHFTDKVEVETVDECLFAMKKKTWKNIKFDEKTFSGWHLYAVDVCLNTKRKGGKAFVIDVRAYHHSPGKVDDSYWRDFKKLIKKYKNDFDYITTTCVCSHTNVIFEWNYLLWKISMLIKKLVSWKYL